MRAVPTDVDQSPPPARSTMSVTGLNRVHDGRCVLSDVDWRIQPGERWVVLGPNGCGKTSLLRIISLWDHPSSGSVEVLGETLGRCDVRTVRRRIGTSSPSLGQRLRPSLRVIDVVVTGHTAALEPWWHTYSDDDHQRARDALAVVGCADLADHQIATLSSGERQRALLARALVNQPELVLLDEPTAGLDFAGRELVVRSLDAMAEAFPQRPVVLVTHHLEEIPASWTHALVMRDGRVEASGPIDSTLTDPVLSHAFDLDVRVRRSDGRWSATLG